MIAAIEALCVSAADLQMQPFPHLVNQPFLDPGLYERLRREWPADELFDETVGLPGSRAGRDIYRGSELYRRHLAGSPAWAEFDDYISSGAYVDSVLELFGGYLSEFGCTVDRRRARFYDTHEGREILAQEGRLRLAYNYLKKLMLGRWRKDRLFVHLALHQSALGYAKPVHCDRRNRLTTNVLFFSDADEIGMQGGDLLVHRHKRDLGRPSRYDRHPDAADTDVVASIRPAHNLGVLMLDCNNSYHSVAPVTKLNRYRDWAYICVSSQEDIIW